MDSRLVQLMELHQEWQLLQPVLRSKRIFLDEYFRIMIDTESCAMTGNTLSFEDAKMLLLNDRTQGNHYLIEYEELKAHDRALDYVQRTAVDKEKELSVGFILKLHELIFDHPYGLNQDKNFVKGEDQVYELISWFNDAVQKEDSSEVELAAMLHYKFMKIHPFDDGNGRVGRFLTNFVLTRFGYPMIYYPASQQNEYLSLIDASDFASFLDYTIERLTKSFDIYFDKSPIIDANATESDKLPKGRSADLISNVNKNVLLPLVDAIRGNIAKLDKRILVKEVLFENYPDDLAENYTEQTAIKINLEYFPKDSDLAKSKVLNIICIYEKDSFIIQLPKIKQPLIKRNYQDYLSNDELDLLAVELVTYFQTLTK